MILSAGSKNKGARKGRNTDSGFDAGVHFKAALTAVFNVVLVLAAIFCIANARIVLNNRIDKLDAEAGALQSKISRLKLESENLRMRKEKLSSWPEISSRIVRFDLKLQAPRHNQIRKLAIVPYNLRDARDAVTYSSTALLSQR